MARTTRVLRCDLPIDVWDRLAEDAAAAGVPIGRYTRDLIVARDKRKHAVSGNAHPVDPVDPVDPGATPSTDDKKMESNP